MPTRDERISRHKKELLGKGYPPGIVDLAMGWALGSAQGMATYVRKQGINDGPEDDFETMTDRFLPQYLRDAEKWIRAFGHEPKQ